MLCIHPCLFVGLCVCLSVSRITQKVMDGFERNIIARTKIRTSAARSMHSKLSVFHCDCYMQNLIKGPHL